MGALEELEITAIKNAQSAVAFDKEGKRDEAINSYQRAIESLIRIVNLQPNYTLNKIYIQRANIYKTRVKALQDVWINNSYKEETTNNGSGHFEDLILKKPPNVTWDEIIGLDDAKRAIKEAVIYPSLRPDLFPLGWPKGILLFGPPGCGKTLLAAAVSNEIKATFICVDAASIMSKWLGEAERNVARLFNMARRAAKENPSIIFIDEVDSLMSVHRVEVGGETRVRNQILKEMDGIIDKKNPVQVYVIGSTNKPWTLDQPFIRRFQKRIYVPPPTKFERKEMFKHLINCLKTSADVKINKLAELTGGFSGSDILDICQSAQLKVNSELFERGEDHSKIEPRTINMSDFMKILGNRQPSISKDTLILCEKWFNTFKAL
jgi:SpoVK/Ycf46/Vps4 family AAA+-type ATPase